MRGLRRVLPLVALLLAAPAGAETLADVQVELGQLAREFNALKAELTTTGATARVGGTDALVRMDVLEAELRRLSARAEDIELRLNSVVLDGMNRINDMQFRICELEPDCDPMQLGSAPPLGGDPGGDAGVSSAAPPVAPDAGTSEPELAVSEKADFDRAREVLGQGDFRTAAELFATYAQSYPGGPLIPAAHYYRGEALAQLGETTAAARAWLDAYSGDPDGDLAPDALLRLGRALGTLGERDDACTTLAEVGASYPGTDAAGEAPAAMQDLGCP